MKIQFTTAVAGRTRGEIADLDEQSAEIVIAQGLAREVSAEPGDESDPAEPTPAEGERRTRRASR